MAPLAGRSEEILRLRHALSIVDNGSGVALAITGEPGMGKSRLLDHLATLAGEGPVPRNVLFAQAAEFGRTEPFGVLIEALDDAVESALAADPGLLDGHARNLLAPILPALRRQDGAGSPHSRTGDHAGQCHELRRLLRTLAAGPPVVLILDDVHWVDRSSAEFLGHLLRHPTIPHLLIALAYRPLQMPALLAQDIERTKRTSRLEMIELPPLTIHEAAELVAPAIPGSELNAAYAASEGNPLYLKAVWRRHTERSAAAGGVDPSLRVLLNAELPAVSADGLHLLQAAAVLGDPFDLLHAVALAGLTDRAADIALEGLVERDLVRPTGSVRVFRFRHALVRDAVYAQTGRGWLVAAHRRAIEQLRGRGAGVVDMARHVAQVAEHGDIEAVTILEEAAHALLAQAPATAAGWLADAERLLPHNGIETDLRRVHLLGELADALLRSGKLIDGSRRLRDLLKLVPLDHHEIRVRYVCGSAESDQLTGRFDRAESLVRAQLGELSQDRTQERATLLVALATGAFLRGALEDALSHARQANALITGDAAPDRRLAALSTLAITAVAGGDVLVAAEASAQAAILFNSLDDGPAANQLVHLAELAWADYYLGWHDQALRVAREATRLAQRTGHLSTLPLLLLCASRAHLHAGRLRQALDVAGQAEEIARSNGSDDHLSMALAAKAEAVLWLDGSTAPATRLAVEALAAAGWRTGLAGRKAAFVLVETALTTGRPQHSVRQLLSAGGGPALPAWPHTCRPKVFEVLTRAALASGDLDQAERWAANAERTATHSEFGGPSYARLARARLFMAHGDPKMAAGLALTAADGFGNEGFLIEEGRSRAVAAYVLTQAGAVRDAVPEVRRIMRIARDCESTRLAVMAQHTTVTVPSTNAGPSIHRDPYAPLSRREREVAALLATGMTNREIANRLDVTVRTVDAHVSRILRKLGVPSRAAVVGLQLPDGTTSG